MPEMLNLISGNFSNGVRIEGIGAPGNVVQGNFIGTDVSGTIALGNAAGVEIQGSNNQVGGTTTGARNVISGNLGGVSIVGSGNLVQGNYIGTDVTGTADLGNLAGGVGLNGSNNIIGGTVPGAGNLIAFNGTLFPVHSGDGVAALGFTTGNAILSNSFFFNVDQGIDLNADGATPNDPGDADAGANNLQNFPVMQAEIDQFTGELVIEYNVDSNPSHSTYPLRIEFFEADADMSGEGKIFLGSAAFTIADFNSGEAVTNLGNAASLGVNAADFIVATATDDAGNTSEFSPPVVVAPAADLSLAKTDNPDPVRTGNNLTYTLAITNHGPSLATGVVLTDNLPAEVSFISATSSQGTCIETQGIVTCNLGNLGNGNSATVVLLGTANSSTPKLITNAASMTSDLPDPITTNNAVSEQTTISLGPTTFVVNTIDDIDDGECNATHCSLREAINVSNLNPDFDQIAFNIPGPGPHSIQLTALLPAITNPVMIDGTTEPDFSNTPIVELDGSLLGAFAAGLKITAGNSIVRGLAINRCAFLSGGFLEEIGVGILIDQNGGNVIEGCFLGTDVTGTIDLGNGGAGIFIKDFPNNKIGGTTPGARNLISGNDIAGVVIGLGFTPEAKGNLVQGNFIGTDVTGTVALSNSGAAVFISGPHNTVGGSTAGARNLISGNFGSGITIGTGGSTGAEGNIVQGNFIGSDITGTTALGNADYGVQTFIGSDTSTIKGNLITGNNRGGIFLVGSNNKIQSNFIGTNATGTAALGNNGDGIATSGFPTENLIGGTTPADRNVISGNFGDGIEINGSMNLIQGNFIGVDVTGASALGNSGVGVKLNGGGATVGGTTSGTGNVISSNGSHGVEVTCCGAGQIQSNFIGTDVTGAAALGNSGNGVSLQSASNQMIGGTTTGAGNIIAFNGGDGVFIHNFLPPFTTGNAILSNSIFSNTGLGIDLEPDGVTLNDPGDGDIGANNLQNFPVLISATSKNDRTTIKGRLNSTRKTTFIIQFFSNPACDPSHFGEGRKFLGSLNVTIGDKVPKDFTATFSASVPKNHFITATATDPNGNASEFAQCIQISQSSALVANADADLDDDIAAEETPSVPEAFALYQNYPNPFNRLIERSRRSPETEISFALPEASDVVLKIFNLMGAEIRTLVDEQREAGYHRARWDGKDKNGKAVASGVYLYQLQAGSFSQVKKMSLLR